MTVFHNDNTILAQYRKEYSELAEHADKESVEYECYNQIVAFIDSLPPGAGEHRAFTFLMTLRSFLLSDHVSKEACPIYHECAVDFRYDTSIEIEIPDC